MYRFLSQTRKLFKKSPKRLFTRLVNINAENVENFRAAGSVFTDSKIILAGYQPRKKKPFISGIGGKREEGESYMDTAIRETVEELFEFKDTPKELLGELKTSIVPQKVLQNGSYIIVVYNFNDLERFLSIIQKYKLHSVLYNEFPKNLMELIFNRNLEFPSKKVDVFFKPELSHLSLLPLVQHDKANPFVDPYFVKDMVGLLK